MALGKVAIAKAKSFYFKVDFGKFSKERRVDGLEMLVRKAKRGLKI